MDIQQIIRKIDLYGPIIIFALFYLEGVNLSGIPASIFMPAVGFYSGTGKYSFIVIFFIAVFAGLLGNLTYYGAAYKVGEKLCDKVTHKFPKTRKPLSKAIALSEKYGDKACFIGRLIPGIRVFISLISGIFRVRLKRFTIYSALGIIVWDFVAIFIGYLVAVKGGIIL